MLELIIENSNNPIVRVGGILSYTSAEQVKQELMAVISTLESSVLWVDMTDVRFMDSAGLLSLFHVLSRARGVGKGLVLCQIPPCVRLVLKMTGLTESFYITDSVDLCKSA